MSAHNPTINDIRAIIKENLQKRVYIESQRSKKKHYSRPGILAEAYSNIFVVELEEASGHVVRLSYSYIDLLTNHVQVVVLDEQDVPVCVIGNAEDVSSDPSNSL